MTVLPPAMLPVNLQHSCPHALCGTCNKYVRFVANLATISPHTLIKSNCEESSAFENAHPSHRLTADAGAVFDQLSYTFGLTLTTCQLR